MIESLSRPEPINCLFEFSTEISPPARTPLNSPDPAQPPEERGKKPSTTFREGDVINPDLSLYGDSTFFCHDQKSCHCKQDK
ncbi:hypothetical protein Ae717Ps2_6132 [Pseudonocardia sp. Ae717_Ps2]|nr:hypothetical protein Ae717Ps2_6132 [Pseudonocardia sp. Ae717_Ps2]